MNLILSGYNGYIGQEILNLATNDPEINIIAGVSRSGKQANPNNNQIEVYKSFTELNKQNKNSVLDSAECIIDFSHHDTTKDMTDFAKKHNIPLVIATTGHTDNERKIISEAANIIPVFFTANYSIGIALLVDHAKQIAKSFGEDADIEIVEVHHNRKADAPSGTALTIAHNIQEVLPQRKIHAGSAGLEPRAHDEIGINSVRMGNIVGIHEVHICNQNECITLKHEAFSRALFANGAIKAASFIIDKKPGLYNMNSLIGN